MRSFAVLVLSILASCSARPVFAQCSVSFNFVADGSSATVNNRQAGCIEWQLSYNASNASALSLLLESAPDNNGSPGAWVSFDGTVTAGINPNVATDQAYTLATGYNPWVRVTLSGLMGASARVSGTIKGLLAPPPGGGVFPQPAIVSGCGPAGNPPDCDPVFIGVKDNVGNVVAPLANVDGALTQSLNTGAITAQQFETDFTCSEPPTPIVLTASGLTEIIALTSMKAIRVCHISMSGDAAVNVKFSTGTGSNCGTGTADLTGLYYGINSLALDFSNHAALRVPEGQALCVSLSGAANWGGVVIFGKF